MVHINATRKTMLLLRNLLDKKGKILLACSARAAPEATVYPHFFPINVVRKSKFLFCCVCKMVARDTIRLTAYYPWFVFWSDLAGDFAAKENCFQGCCFAVFAALSRDFVFSLLSYHEIKIFDWLVISFPMLFQKKEQKNLKSFQFPFEWNGTQLFPVFYITLQICMLRNFLFRFLSCPRKCLVSGKTPLHCARGKWKFFLFAEKL